MCGMHLPIISMKNQYLILHVFSCLQAARMLAERRERLSADPSSDAPPAATQSVVESLRAQSETVTQSLTALVDQQRQQNAEILRMARLSPAGKHKRAIVSNALL